MTTTHPELGEYPPAGAVLSSEEIEALCFRPKPLIEPFSDDSLKPAAYDVVIARDGMITPDGTVFKPGNRCTRPIVLEPGDTAFLSTYEVFDMPGSLTATISIKASLARQGVLLLTGLVVDPHYRREPGNDGRLHFTLANLGGDPVVIEPEHTPVVTVQFIRTSGRPPERPVTSVTNLWENPQELVQLSKGLGFIQVLRDMRRQLDETTHRLERQSMLTEYALIAGLFLLATTILGVSAASILSAASEHRIVEDVRHVIPASPGKRVFLIVVSISAAWIVYSLSQAVVRAMSVTPPDRKHADAAGRLDGYVHRSALASLRIDRLVGRTAAGVAVVILATGVVAGVVAIGNVSSWWWTIPIVLGVVTICAAAIVRALWKPIQAHEVNQRVAQFYERAIPPPPTQGGW